MKAFGIFYQREGTPEIEHVEVDSAQAVRDLKDVIRAKHGGEPAEFLFLEDADEPLGDDVIIESLAGPRGAKVHVHRCRRVAVSIHFAGRTLEYAFGPGATVGRLKHWAAVEELGMSKEDASEHVLQITGTTERPRPSAHVGTLSKCPQCAVSFDLVPEQRVNGGSP